MLLDILRFLLRLLLNFFGFGIRGELEFEDGEIFRKKLNLRFQKEKADDGLPLFDGKLLDVPLFVQILNVLINVGLQNH